MRAEDLVALYTLLQERGVQLWVDGGWGIDALLGEQTRPHKDFDALVQFNDLAVMTEALAERGFVLKEIWSENRWVVHPVSLGTAEVWYTAPLDTEVRTAGCSVHGVQGSGSPGRDGIGSNARYINVPCAVGV